MKKKSKYTHKFSNKEYTKRSKSTRHEGLNLKKSCNELLARVGATDALALRLRISLGHLEKNWLAGKVDPHMNNQKRLEQVAKALGIELTYKKVPKKKTK